MCLNRSITDNPLKEATEDIICYKGVQVPYEKWFKIKTFVLRKLKRFKDYKTYFTEDRVTIGMTFVAMPELSQERLDWTKDNEEVLEAGFVHSFKNKEDAIAFAKARTYIDVVKCIIPKGTYYFEGINSDYTKGYASTQLKYVKVI